MLAALAIAGGDVVSADRLADIVWNGEPPETTNALQTYVSRLRSLLGGEVTTVIELMSWRTPSS